MPSPQELREIARAIAEHVAVVRREPVVNVSYLDSGSTSTVFRLTLSTQQFILRIATGDREATAYGTDFLVRTALWGVGGHVARPIATSSLIDLDVGVDWVLDSTVEGVHPARGKIPASVSRQLGTVLHRLHDLETDRFGRLVTVGTRIQGRATDPVEGLLTRFDSPWPFTPASLADNPAVLSRPHLEARLQPLASRFEDFVNGGSSVVVHSDLHEGQVLVCDGNLMALLDFNDAMAARCEWDFGSYLYFHGPGCLLNLLDGYTGDTRQKARYVEGARLASLLIALHHANRGKARRLDHRIQSAVTFLEGALQ